MKQYIVRMLLRLYPAAWRREYGPELLDVLLARPLTVRIVADVLWNGLWQRSRDPEPSTILGLVLMVVVLIEFVRSESILSPYTSNLYVLILVGCGVWTHLRHGGEESQSGRAAVKVSFIAGIPVMLAGLLMLLGMDLRAVSGQCWFRVSDASSHLKQIQSAVCPPASVGVLISPVFLLAASWLWGVLGGALGRRISRLSR